MMGGNLALISNKCLYAVSDGSTNISPPLLINILSFQALAFPGLLLLHSLRILAYLSYPNLPSITIMHSLLIPQHMNAIHFWLSLAVIVMELQESRAENSAMTFDEVSMERSKSFVKALQVYFSVLFVVFIRVGFRSGDLGSRRLTGLWLFSWHWICVGWFMDLPLNVLVLFIISFLLGRGGYILSFACCYLREIRWQAGFNLLIVSSSV